MAPKNVLMLQGPIGHFFFRLSGEFSKRGVAVTKVNFNGGDALFFRGSNTVAYRDPMEEWPAFFRKLVADKSIDTLFLVGDHRSMHKPIIPIAKQLGIAVWVFEEGYLRPDHITLERDGVNGNSTMSKDPDFYRRAVAQMGKQAKAGQVGNTFASFASQSIAYHSALATGAWYFPHYQHHRDVRLAGQTVAWTKSYWRKKRYAYKERGVLEKAVGAWSGDYFLVPLQLYCDFQIDHSDYESIPAFIEEVVETFAKHAPQDTRLILKHHPLDRAYRDYTDLLERLGRRLGITQRLHYVHDLHLPSLLKHARGVVTMNSTVGTSALLHKAPVKVMGRAIYNIPQLTYQGSLANFFCEVCVVDTKLFKAFNRWMRENNQYNGSFYKEARGMSPERAICDRLCAEDGESDDSEDVLGPEGAGVKASS